MIANAEVFQPGVHPGFMADAFAARPQEVGHRLPTTLIHSATSNRAPAPVPEAAQSIMAEVSFPQFGYSLPVVIKSIRSQLTDTERLLFQIELDEGVVLKWGIKGPIKDGQEVVFERTWEIALASSQPRANFIASTLQALLLLDQQAELEAVELPFSANIHIPDSLDKVSAYLQHRQLAYRLMVIEKACGQEFQLPQFMSNAERSTVDFVYRAVTDRSFAWPFWQETGRVSANQETRELLAKVDGTFPFLIEIGCFQQALLGQTLDLGEVNITVQNTALANAAEVERELQQLDGHSFQVVIQSLSGAATFEFLEAPRLPDALWDKRIEQLIKLEDQLDELYFEAVNQLAAASIDEETALEQESLLSDLTFDFSNDDDSTSASTE